MKCNYTVLTRKGSKGQGVGGQCTRERHKDVRIPLCTLCMYIFSEFQEYAWSIFLLTLSVPYCSHFHKITECPGRARWIPEAGENSDMQSRLTIYLFAYANLFHQGVDRTAFRATASSGHSSQVPKLSSAAVNLLQEFTLSKHRNRAQTLRSPCWGSAPLQWQRLAAARQRSRQRADGRGYVTRMERAFLMVTLKPGQGAGGGVNRLRGHLPPVWLPSRSRSRPAVRVALAGRCHGPTTRAGAAGSAGSPRRFQGRPWAAGPAERRRRVLEFLHLH